MIVVGGVWCAARSFLDNVIGERTLLMLHVAPFSFVLGTARVFLLVSWTLSFCFWKGWLWRMKLTANRLLIRFRCKKGGRWRAGFVATVLQRSTLIAAVLFLMIGGNWEEQSPSGSLPSYGQIHRSCDFFLHPFEALIPSCLASCLWDLLVVFIRKAVRDFGIHSWYRTFQVKETVFFLLNEWSSI